MQLTCYKVSQLTTSPGNLVKETRVIAYFVTKKQAKKYIKTLEKACAEGRITTFTRVWRIEESLCEVDCDSAFGDV